MHFLLLTLRVWRAFVVARRGFLVGGKAYAVLEKKLVFLAINCFNSATLRKAVPRGE